MYLIFPEVASRIYPLSNLALLDTYLRVISGSQISSNSVEGREQFHRWPPFNFDHCSSSLDHPGPSFVLFLQRPLQGTGLLNRVPKRVRAVNWGTGAQCPRTLGHPFVRSESKEPVNQRRSVHLPH